MQQQRSREAANESHDGNRGCVVEQGQARSLRDKNRQVAKRRLLRDKVVITKRCIRRQVEQYNAATGQYLREDSPAAPLILEAKRIHDYTGRNPNRDAAEFADPTIVKRVLEKKRGREQDQCDGGPTQPATTNH